MAEFTHQEILPLGPDDTSYRLVSTEGVSTVETPLGEFLRVEPEALRLLTAEAMFDINHFLRTGHLTRVVDAPPTS